jgi:hypothetical protein
VRTAADTFAVLRGAVLGEVGARDVDAAVSRHGWPSVVWAACWHGVENHLYRALLELDPERFDLAPLESLYRRSIAVHLRAVSDLARISPALAAEGIPLLAVKGPVLAELHPEPDLRAYSDLDLLVPRPQFGEAVAALERRGARLLDREWAQIRSENRTQVHLEAIDGTSIDLHWHLLNRGIARSGLAIDMRSLFERRRRTQVHGIECLTTDPVDTALHVAVHAGVSGGARLSHIADVSAVLTVADLDWDELCRRARQWGAGEMVAIMAARAGRVLGMQPPPEDALRRLSTPGGWSALVTAMEPRARPELRSDSGPIARLTRAARPGRARSAATAVAWFGFQARGWLSRRLRTPSGPGRSADEQDARRREYFASVASPDAARRSPD